ncbi:MAG TPA: tetratricopeptide repeat protein [Azospirillaceae bacterium]|nr:tetratricopeptide repeat protein [Azospirillaceae bacterium]
MRHGGLPPIPSPALLLLLQAGLAHQKAGRLAEADRAYRQVLAADPRNADALQLLGLLAKQAGRPDIAADLMRRSLAVNPRQPNVHNNLGNALGELGDAPGALAAYGEAARQKPDYVDAHFNRAVTLDGLGRRDEAEAALRTALRLDPRHLGALTNLAVLLQETGRLEEADTVGRRALDLAPGSARLLQNQGLTLRRLNRAEEAVELYRRALSADPDLKEAWHNLGNALSALDRNEEAIEAYRRALALDPASRDGHANLSKLLWRMGRADEVLDSYDRAVALRPDDPALLEIRAEAASHYGRREEAAAALERALALSGGTPQIHRTYGTVLLALDRPAEAGRQFEAGLALAADHPTLLRGLAESRLRAGDTAAALETARRLGAVSPDDQHAVAYEALALRLLGDPAEARLYDYDRFVRAMQVDVPDGYADLEAFNADLLAALTGLHGTKVEPIDQTLRHGTQTSEALFSRDVPQIKALRGVIEAAVNRYVRELPDDPGHPYLRRKTERWGFTGSWSARLRDQGYHTDHVHPAGWISGCYYVEVPAAVAGETEKQGWIKFGEPNVGPEIRLPWVRAVRPEPGRLVLFPSYFWHGTIPFRGPEHRTTVAFDLAPLA